MPYRTEIAPVLIVARLEEFAYGEATAIAVVLLVISFSILTRGDTGDLIEVELSKERYWEMQIAPGERVFITPRQLKVFAQGH